MSAQLLTALLAKRYAAPAYAFLQQVRNQTGYSRTVRTADALALSLWPSRGLDLHGFEIKISRNDWQKELAQPAKAEEIARFCDRWWIVVSRPEIVQPGELPPTWGLLAVVKDKLKVITEAPKQKPQPLTKGFVASVLRNVAEAMVPTASIADANHEQYERGKKDARSEKEWQLKDLTDRVQQFESASGVSLKERWGCGDIGRAVKFIRDSNLAESQARSLQSAEQLLRSAEAVVRQMQSTIESLKKIEPAKVEDVA